MKNIKFVILGLFLLTVAGCAPKRPVLYDNAAYKKNPAKAESAVDECLRRAEERGVAKDKLAEAGKRAGKGAAASAAAGAAGAATGNAFGYNYDVGASAGVSAAEGAAGNLALGLMDDSVDDGLANYVSHCLKEKGYTVVTWK